MDWIVKGGSTFLGQIRINLEPSYDLNDRPRLGSSELTLWIVWDADLSGLLYVRMSVWYQYCQIRCLTYASAFWWRS